MIKTSRTYEQALDFAVDLTHAIRQIQFEQREFTLTRQLLRSGTSIGANLTEANGAISDADFKSKLSIAYKEALETKYWLELLKRTSILSETGFNSLFGQVDSLAAQLFSAIRTLSAKHDSKSSGQIR